MNQHDSLWQTLVQQADAVCGQTMQQMFAADVGRGERFSLRYETLYLDYSRNLVDEQAIKLLCRLAEQQGLSEKIAGLFGGADVNRTQARPALHTLLRQTAGGDGGDVAVEVRVEREKMYQFCRRLRAGELRGAGGKAIGRLVHIGIGGSALGPRLLLDALGDYQDDAIGFDFVANIDPAEIDDVLAGADPETTLFIVVSKSFCTEETRHNAEAAKQWLQQHGCTDYSRHFVGVSEDVGAVADFGIVPEYYFRLWPWVGGRYSVWSSVGLIACAVLGEDVFSRVLGGAESMDQHFRRAALPDNIPVLLGLLSIWYINLLDYTSHAVVPYAHRLRLLPDYLGQLVMESNGKSVTGDGVVCDYDTAPVVWGGAGSNAQHAFFQLLHQGSRKTTLDFIAVARGRDQAAQDRLLANCIAQGKALLEGKADRQQPHRHIEGNRPSTTLLFDELNPYNLGMLLALYEHKTFVESVLWDIDAFDQWGVELGKTLATEIGACLQDAGAGGELDPSSAGLLAFYRQCKRSE
ncbi:MAG: glucose-6-phosphate isomerase [Gammaproteobacteria bacterium]